MDAGRRFFADAADRRRDPRVARLVFRHRLANRLEDDAPLFGILVRVERRNLPRLLELDALVHQQRRVAAVVDDQRRPAAVGPFERLLRAPPVLVERLAFPGVDRRAFRILCRAARLGPADDDRRRRVILRRKDVARHPANIRAELGQRLDENGGLNRHVERAHDPRAGERFGGAVLVAQRHQARHLLFGEADFLAPELGKRQILHFVGFAPRGVRGGKGVHSFSDCRHFYCLLAVATNNPGPLAFTSGGSGFVITSPNPLSPKSRSICSSEKPSHTWPIC